MAPGFSSWAGSNSLERRNPGIARLRRPALIALFAAVAGTAGYLWWRTPAVLSAPSTAVSAGANRASAARAGNTTTAQDPTTGTDGWLAGPPASARSYAGVPLPPADAPLNQTVATLLERAQAGDVRAACRLSADLLRCRNARALADVFAKYSLPVDAGLPAEATRRLERALDAVDQCKDVPPAAITQGPHWLRWAADAGSRDAMVMFATGAGFGSGGGIFAMLHSPDFDYWRRRAPDMLRQALRQGSADAALALARGAQGDDTPIAALIPNDPVQGNAYQLLWLRLNPGSKGRMAVLTPAQNTQVAELADTMFRDDFDGAAPTMPVATLRATDFNANPTEGLCDDASR